MDMNDLKRFLIEDCQEHFELPGSYDTWSEYLSGYIMDTVVDDLDRYLPNWEYLSPETFEAKVLNTEVPDYTGQLTSLRSQWLALITP